MLGYPVDVTQETVALPASNAHPPRPAVKSDWSSFSKLSSRKMPRLKRFFVSSFAATRRGAIEDRMSIVRVAVATSLQAIGDDLGKALAHIAYFCPLFCT